MNTTTKKTPKTQFHLNRSTETVAMKTLITLSLALVLAACGEPAPMADESTLKVSVEAQGLDGGTAPTGVVSMNETCSFSQEHKTATSESITVPGSTEFKVCAGIVNLVPVFSAGWDISPASELKVTVGKNGGTARIILVKSAAAPVVNVTIPDVDLTNPIAAANAAGGKVDTECNALVTSTTGFKAGTVTRDALVASLGKCTAEKQNAIGAWNALQVALNMAKADNAKRTEAQTALDSLKGKLEAAEKATVAAESALNEPPKVEGTLKASALTASSAGQLAEGVTITVGTNPTDKVICTTTAAAKTCIFDLLPGTYSAVFTKAGCVTQNSLVVVVQNGVSTVQAFLPTVPANQPVAGDLVPITDFVLAKGATQNMAGLFRKYDASLQPVVILDADITLAVSGAGTTATVAGKVISATQSTGGTRFKWTWNNGTPANLADDKFLEFTVVVY